MDKVALKIIIAGRTYPLTIKKEEEEVIREAAEKINANIKKLQGSYAVKDMQDLLAMTALQLGIQVKNGSSEPVQTAPIVDEDLKLLIDKISAGLSS